MNVYQLCGIVDGTDRVSANGRMLDPVPASAGNLWQRFTLMVMMVEYGADRRRHPCSYLLFSRYMPAPPEIELTSDNLARVADEIEAKLKVADELHLVNAITDLDYPLAEGLLSVGGVIPGHKSIRALVSAYESFKPASSRPRRELLRVLLQGGLDVFARVGGKTLLHHLCAGGAPAQDIRELLQYYDLDNINVRDHYGDTPLLCYCRRRGDFPPAIAGLVLLLDAGADPDLANRGETACRLLLRDGQPGYKRLVEQLLEYGADQFA